MNTELTEAQRLFINDYCYAGRCWVCGAELEKGQTVCEFVHKVQPAPQEEK